MLYREITAVCSQINTKHVTTLFGQNVEFVNVKSTGASRKVKFSIIPVATQSET
jgi:hypothetical protein